MTISFSGVICVALGELWEIFQCCWHGTQYHSAAVSMVNGMPFSAHRGLVRQYAHYAHAFRLHFCEKSMIFAYHRRLPDPSTDAEAEGTAACKPAAFSILDTLPLVSSYEKAHVMSCDGMLEEAQNERHCDTPGSVLVLKKLRGCERGESGGGSVPNGDRQYSQMLIVKCKYGQNCTTYSSNNKPKHLYTPQSVWKLRYAYCIY